MSNRPAKPEPLSEEKPRPDAAADAQSALNQRAEAQFAAAKKDKNSLYEYLPLECPNCCMQGRAKISRLDRTFSCKHCGRVFHVTIQGAIIGERPPEEVAPDPSALVELDKPNLFERWFSRLAPGTRWAALGGALLAMVGLFILFKKVQEDPLPARVDLRAALAGEALAKGDWHTLERMAMPGTTEALRKWYDDVSREGLSGVTMESNLRAKVGAMDQLVRRGERNSKGKKVAVADFRTSVEVRLPDAQTALRVDFVWVENSDRRWQIDGEWMVSHSKTSLVEAPVEKAGEAGDEGSAGGANE